MQTSGSLFRESAAWPQLVRIERGPDVPVLLGVHGLVQVSAHLGGEMVARLTRVSNIKSPAIC